MLKDKAHGPFPDLRGIAFVLVHCSILSRNGVSGKSGAIHFDGNNEAEHFGIAKFLIHDMEDRFEHFNKHELNSHYPVIDRYRRMLAAYNAIRERQQEYSPLTAGQIIDVLTS